MAKKWVLDTETKGTGAQVLPLERSFGSPPGNRPAVRGSPRAQAHTGPEPARPRRFKVVDVMTREVLAEGASTRATVETAGRHPERTVDVAIYVWSDRAEKWEPLSFAESKMLWDFRGRNRLEP